MFAPQDALPLPALPNLDQYKKLAKELARAANSADPSALRAWITHWIDSLAKLSNLILTPQLPVRLEHWIDQLDRFALAEKSGTKLTLTKSQFILARAHGFESWTKFARHIRIRFSRQHAHLEFRASRRRHHHRRSRKLSRASPQEFQADPRSLDSPASRHASPLHRRQRRRRISPENSAQFRRDRKASPRCGRRRQRHRRHLRRRRDHASPRRDQHPSRASGPAGIAARSSSPTRSISRRQRDQLLSRQRTHPRRGISSQLAARRSISNPPPVSAASMK